MVAADSDRIPRVPPYSGGTLEPTLVTRTGLSPSAALLSGRFRFLHASSRELLQPRNVLERHGLGSVPFDRHYSGYRSFFLFLRVLRCFSSPGSPQISLVTGLQPAGLPHSDMRGSTPVCGSPRLFAAYHVLRRLRKPRHPPFALILFLVRQTSQPRRAPGPPVNQLDCIGTHLTVHAIVSF